MPRYWHGGRDAVDPTKFYPESLSIDDNDPDSKELVEAERKRIRSEVAKAHPLTSPASRDSQAGKNDRALVYIDGKLKLKRPLAFCQRINTFTDAQGKVQTQVIQEYDDWIPGSLVLALVGYGYWVIPPGGHVDLDVSMPERLVKSYAPHLLNESEYAELQERTKNKPQSKNKTAAPQPQG